MDTSSKGQPNWAKGYKISYGKPVEVEEYAHYWKHGAGGYKSNIRDFARFALALINKELINERISNLMWTRQETMSGELSKYGLGVIVTGIGKNTKISHNGSQNEVRTRMVVYPNRKDGVVIMCL